MATANPFRFSTKYHDEETDLLYYGYRYYDPNAGRWLNRDPVWELGGLNLYGYVRNNPIKGSDRLGLAGGAEGAPGCEADPREGFIEQEITQPWSSSTMWRNGKPVGTVTMPGGPPIVVAQNNLGVQALMLLTEWNQQMQEFEEDHERFLAMLRSTPVASVGPFGSYQVNWFSFVVLPSIPIAGGGLPPPVYPVYQNAPPTISIPMYGGKR
jgi:RHS repeat-associated protein